MNRVTNWAERKLPHARDLAKRDEIFCGWEGDDAAGTAPG
jgi:hypothetical protein